MADGLYSEVGMGHEGVIVSKTAPYLAVDAIKKGREFQFPDDTPDKIRKETHKILKISFERLLEQSKVAPRPQSADDGLVAAKGTVCRAIKDAGFQFRSGDPEAVRKFVARVAENALEHVTRILAEKTASARRRIKIFFSRRLRWSDRSIRRGRLW